jgi:hypothetical protein
VASNDLAFVLLSASGLAARSALTGSNREMVWYPIDHPAYQLWRREMLATTGAKVIKLPDAWSVVERLRKRGIVKGYVLFRHDATSRQAHARGDYDPSVNAATVIAGHLGGVLVSETTEAAAKAHGLMMLADARGVTEEECFERWGDKCSRDVLAMIDPKFPHSRAEAIALNAFVVGSHGPLLQKALARLKPDSPILGWGMGDEFQLTEPVSRWGAWQSATNWCLNLPALSTEQVGETIPARDVRVRHAPSVWDLRWEDGVHYASFLMTDGDNVQWLMGEFQFSGERAWWNSPARGKFPMGWGTCAPDLAQLCPYALRNLVRTAKLTDDLVLLGGGYYYPDLFGMERRDTDTLRIHARRMRAYMRMTGMRVLHMNAQKWDSEAAVRAYTVFAEEIPELYGILMIQYAPYSGGQGRVIWVKRRDGTDLPVVSARFAIWGHSPFPDDGPPAEIARRLNAMPVVCTTPALTLPRQGGGEGYAVAATPETSAFSWVSVHCWSWFKEAPPGAPEDAEEVDQARWRELGAKRGLEPVEWCVRRLGPKIRVVKPTEMLMLVNLRLRPEQTLRRALAELEARLEGSPAARRRVAELAIAEARRMVARRQWRAAFAAGKRAATALAGGASPARRP